MNELYLDFHDIFVIKFLDTERKKDGTCLIQDELNEDFLRKMNEIRIDESPKERKQKTRRKEKNSKEEKVFLRNLPNKEFINAIKLFDEEGLCFEDNKKISKNMINYEYHKNNTI